MLFILRQLGVPLLLHNTIQEIGMDYRVSVPIAIAGLLIVLAAARFIIKHRKGDPRVWERAIRRFEKNDRRCFPPEGVIVFTGSSSIRFWKSLQTNMAPLPVVNRGFGGAQIHDVTHYVRRIVTPYKPKAVVFYAGENDIAGMLLSKRKAPEEILVAFGDFCRAVHTDLPHVPIYFIAAKVAAQTLASDAECQSTDTTTLRLRCTTALHRYRTRHVGSICKAAA
jgi:hypothetical protein